MSKAMRINKEVGSLLRAIRLKSSPRISQNAMARLLKTSASHVYSVEQGLVSAKIDTLERFAKALGRRLRFSLEEE